MNQAYFTFCCSGAGKSLSGLGGDRVRAAVKGSSESELTLYKQYCNYPQYSQSSKTDSSSETTFDSEQFAKLVLGKTETGANAQRFLAQGNASGRKLFFSFNIPRSKLLDRSDGFANVEKSVLGYSGQRRHFPGTAAN